MDWGGPISAVLNLINTAVDKAIPDPIEKAKVQAEIAAMQQRGELEVMTTQLSAIIAEAKSKDPWTSRARPSFLYVVYILLLWSIPMGFMFMAFPDASARFTEGFKAWMHAIPVEIIELFKMVMLGYIGGRSVEKTASTVSAIIGRKK